MVKKPEPFRFNSMSKAELTRTVKTLDKRQTKLLNEIARLKADVSRPIPAATIPSTAEIMVTEAEERRKQFGPWPWEANPLPNPFESEK